jgi:predicted ATPase
MPLNRLRLEKFTVFDLLDINLSPGLNILIGENGVGKTHILKVLYSACQAAQAQSTAFRFNQKLVRVFRPDNLRINRLVKRGGGAGTRSSKIIVYTKNSLINMYFHSKSKTWDAEIKNERLWEKQSDSLISIFIPSKEILSNAHKLPSAIDQSIITFDDTYKDIIQMASVGIPRGRDSLSVQKYAKILKNFGSLSVEIVDEMFYLKQGNNAKFEFNLVSEGIRKIALLWQLVKNGTFSTGSILFWDEPEANINPINYPIIAEMLLELQRDGVQIFLATHDYFFAKYLDVRKNNRDDISYHALYFKDSSIQCEQSPDFEGLKNNAIIVQSINLYDEEVKKVMG